MMRPNPILIHISTLYRQFNGCMIVRMCALFFQLIPLSMGTESSREETVVEQSQTDLGMKSLI